MTEEATETVSTFDELAQAQGICGAGAQAALDQTISDTDWREREIRMQAMHHAIEFAKCRHSTGSITSVLYNAQQIYVFLNGINVLPPEVNAHNG